AGYENPANTGASACYHLGSEKGKRDYKFRGNIPIRCLFSLPLRNPAWLVPWQVGDDGDRDSGGVKEGEGQAYSWAIDQQPSFTPGPLSLVSPMYSLHFNCAPLFASPISREGGRVLGSHHAWRGGEGRGGHAWEASGLRPILPISGAEGHRAPLPAWCQLGRA
uniref:Uncharacterized protein n=1 Tax=Varanus komodoensis TaxID=61221 RepID=A0A8D2LE56_VARKO